jgi:integrase
MSVREKIGLVKGEPVKFWIADYSDGAGRRHQRRFKTKKEAAAHHDSTKTAIRAGQHVALPHDFTIALAADKWLKKVAADGRERATIKTYREHVAHILPRIGALKLAKMTNAHVKVFRDGLLEGDKALSRDMAAKVLTSLKGILKASEVSHLGDNVTVKNAKRGKLKLEAGRDIPTPEEVAQLVKAAKPGRIRTLVMVAASTGLRASELRGLRWSDVDLTRGEVHVRQRADRFNEIGAPKTVGSNRAVPIGPEVIHALKEWKIANGKRAFVFSTSTGTIDNHSNVLRSFETVQATAHVLDKHGKPKYGMHALRHFFASWCINSKASGGRELPVKEVQTLLGHSSITMTLDVYGHLFPRRDDRTELAASERRLFHLSAT